MLNSKSIDHSARELWTSPATQKEWQTDNGHSTLNDPKRICPKHMSGFRSPFQVYTNLAAINDIYVIL